MQPSGAGFRQKSAELTYVVEADLLVGPAKRRHSPRPATPKTADSYRSSKWIDTRTPLPSLHPGPVLPIFLFAQVGITEIVLVRKA
jgi:hypothetical protein